MDFTKHFATRLRRLVTPQWEPIPGTAQEPNSAGWEIDAFVVYTDSETWAGDVHPVQALRQYREATGIAAKLVVVGMASNGFTIADSDDPGMLDVVGFDTATPQLIGDFVGNGGAEGVG